MPLKKRALELRFPLAFRCPKVNLSGACCPWAQRMNNEEMEELFSSGELLGIINLFYCDGGVTWKRRRIGLHGMSTVVLR